MANVTAAPKTFALTAEEAYLLAHAALDVVGSVSPSVMARCRAERQASKRPLVNPEALAQLADALDTIRPGIVAALYENQR